MIYSINEGQQADEYKARKAKEAEDKKKAEDQRLNTRHDPYNSTGLNPRKKEEPHMHKGGIKVAKELEKDKDFDKKYIDKSKGRVNTSYSDAIDAGYRHQRRHPKQYKEGTVFESVEFI